MNAAFPSSPRPSHAAPVARPTAAMTSALAGHLADPHGFRAGAPPSAAALGAGATWVGARFSPGQAVGVDVVAVYDRATGATAPVDVEAVVAAAATLAPLAGKTSLGLADAHVRFTAIEIGEGPVAQSDLARLGALHREGAVLVAAYRVDALALAAVAAGPAWSAATSASIGMASPRAWIDGALAVHARAQVGAYGAPGWSTTAPLLFSARAIAVASALLSPFTGALMLAWNFEATRRRGTALALAFGGAALLAGLMVVFMHGPSIPTSFGLHLLACAALAGVARQRFGDPVRKVPVGGTLGAMGVSVVMILVTAVAMALLVPAPAVATRVTDKTVEYTWGERTTAQRVAAALDTSGLVADERVLGASVAREKDKLTVTLRTSQDAWTDDAVVQKAQAAADDLARVTTGEVSLEIGSELGIEQKTLTGSRAAPPAAPKAPPAAP
ncbi:MAG: hypothetical protein JNL38_01375 [Myxococcales bacterium]|nr:hypothetical protein [Myxococcales bacterium]